MQSQWHNRSLDRPVLRSRDPQKLGKSIQLLSLAPFSKRISPLVTSPRALTPHRQHCVCLLPHGQEARQRLQLWLEAENSGLNGPFSGVQLCQAPALKTWSEKTARLSNPPGADTQPSKKTSPRGHTASGPPPHRKALNRP